MSIDIIDSIKELTEPVVTAEGMELVDIDFRRERNGWVLRLYIDREGGVTIDDCSLISKEIGCLIDINDLILFPYTLEVSSPGLNRPLKKEKDFIKNKGKRIKIMTYDPIGKRRTFKGRLLEYKDGGVNIDLGDETINVPFEKISKANLEYEF